MKKLNCLWK